MTRFLRDCWYMAAWSDEVADTVLARRIVDRPFVFMRTASGTVVALADRCPHRFAPLSRGTREGDTLVCGYHGLTFDAAGRCVRNPFSERIPAGAQVPTFPTIERDGIVWLWPGDPERADPAAIPDFSMLAESAWNKTLRGLMPMRANYEFGTDNLLDLSHIEFVHKGSFAGRGVIFTGRHSVRQDGLTLHSDWWMPSVPAPAHTEGAYPRDLVTDHWLEMRWNLPATMYLQIGACPDGAPKDSGVIVHQAHILTPQTEGTTHYFWASTYQAEAGIPDMAPTIRALLEQAFEDEDKPMIEAAYANLDGGDFWEQRPLSLGIDQAGTRARRIVETQLKAELARVPVPVT